MVSERGALARKVRPDFSIVLFIIFFLLMFEDRLRLRRGGGGQAEHVGRQVQLPGAREAPPPAVVLPGGPDEAPDGDQHPGRRHVELRRAVVGDGGQGGTLPGPVPHGGRDEGEEVFVSIIVFAAIKSTHEFLFH